MEEAREAEGRSPDRSIVERAVLAAIADGKVERYWVATEGDELVGSSSVYSEWSDWNAAPYWWLQSFYLVPHARGRGLAARMIDHIEGEARAAGAVELRLYVHRDNARAARAYEKAGFADQPYRVLAKPLTPRPAGR